VSIEFPLRSKLTAFGRVSDPTIPIAVQTSVGERTYMFLLDTGADFSVAPRRLAQQVGLEWTTLPEAQVVGVEQRGVRARVGQLPIRVGSLTCTVRCLFMDTSSAPFILGRADFLDRLILTIDPARQRIVLTDLSSLRLPRMETECPEG
jgi:predicted aspartyl protease